MTVSAINPFQPLPPTPGTVYGNIMDAFFTTLSVAEKQQIWVRFLQANGLTPTTLPIDPTLFLTYVRQLLTTQQVMLPSALNDRLSPQEIKKREIMFGILNSVLDMLLFLQNTVMVEAQNLAFYGRWQDEYTKMLTRVPTYVGGESSAVVVNLNDLSKFTFGYDNISVRDIARWWASNINSPTIQTFVINSAKQVSGFPGISLYFNSGGTEFSSRSIIVTDATANFAGNLIPAGSTFDQNVENFENTFRTFWANPEVQDVLSSFGEPPTSTDSINWATADYLNHLEQEGGNLIQWQIFAPPGAPTAFINPAVDPYVTLRIIKPYAFTIITSSANLESNNIYRNLNDANAKARAELNSRAQQYLENIRSKRQAVQNESQQVSANLDNSRQLLSQQTDLFNSIIESLKGLLSSIYR